MYSEKIFAYKVPNTTTIGRYGELSLWKIVENGLGETLGMVLEFDKASNLRLFFWVYR